MRTRHILMAAFILATIQAFAYKVYVDDNGVMRRDDTGAEVSYYGTNYTVPFAHAYRALGQLGVDRKEAIDRDVYHMARLGFNGFRLHLWDVELSDSIGNLIDNDHLDLLDYLIAQLEKRGIKVTLTAQTNFGNGYPEHDTDPYGAYTYDYDKYTVHSNPDAIKAQQRYVTQLLQHLNPYTGKTYADDEEIIALEVNNEPTHTATVDEVNAYVKTMAKAIRDAGWDKPILYNVSHNLDVTQGYYDDAIDGTTYQWYPLNLVAGHIRKGNFLPYVDEYNIPFAETVTDFDKKAKVIYEFDPADNLYSYLYPAITRTFRNQGFQWITQFAYDPTDMAWSNSEYQTHFLNLAYTPQKALSMMIAAEAAQDIPRGADYGKYPVDTIFGDFVVSAKRDLSMLNNGNKYLYTNSNDIRPHDVDSLTQIAGWGTSPIITYEGTGAYFLDKLEDGVWRLEVMPDVVLTSDPFAKPSLNKRVGEIYYREHPLGVKLPELGRNYAVQGINDGNALQTKATDGVFTVYPGVYILTDDATKIADIDPDAHFLNMAIDEFVAPAPSQQSAPLVVHTPAASVEAGKPLVIDVTVATPTPPDSVMLYPGNVSFWSKDNRLYKMDCIAPYTYQAVINPEELPSPGHPFNYDIVVAYNGTDTTFPANETGNPLNWDYTARQGGYSTNVVNANAPIVVLDASNGYEGIEINSLPTNWGGFRFVAEQRTPLAQNAYRLSLNGADEDFEVILSRYVTDLIANRYLTDDASLTLLVGDLQGTVPDEIEVGFVNTDGFTYTAKVPLTSGSINVPLKQMKLSPTLISPESYPGFINRVFEPDPATATPLHANELERLQILIPSAQAQQPGGIIEIIGAMLVP